ncbi:SGNH/GDSL hydrolase family protein [Imperialibacter roseus]|uniref:SGNH/GDSL hydrolase family protein n=1 Tax=Imperialibacter roseus TaxID=1324217 RepID=A0ABZ0IX44_9BACT|nr:SGNH/GDSL hydrolase family protein [Imperialibacter roseus]WOK09603.1 SGNH/GDSL hydrolase family protein [Imperialibacter roseus]|tara:strand:- start:25050 stop:25760 length:711 start_codon:yes stop_codon:yes gene_type:complete
MSKSKYTFLAIFLLSYIALLGCNEENKQNTESMDQVGSLKFLALGDSYTIGESVAENERWPVQLAAALSQSGVSVAPPKIIATTGWTTDELQKGIEKASPKPPYDLVSLLIGVNNQYRGRSLDEYKRQFEALLVQAINFADGKAEKVFVVSIPDYGVTPFAADRNPEKIGKEIDAFNRAAEAISKKFGVAFVNITPGSREAANDPELVASDGLHPSGKMYTQWVSEIFPIVEEMIK